MRKRNIIYALSAAITLSSAANVFALQPSAAEPPVSAADYSETAALSGVSPEDWFYEDAVYIYENGYLNIQGGIFEPYREISESDFLDSVEKIISSSNIDSFAGKNLNNDGILTREEAADIIFNVIEASGRGPVGAWAARLDFKDISLMSDWAFQPVMFCWINGLITGDEQKNFNPQSPCTYAEAAAILSRFAQKYAEDLPSA